MSAQGELVFSLPAQVRFAIAMCALQSKSFDPIGATAAAFDVYQSGRAPLATGPTAAMPPAGEPDSTARAGRRAGFDAAFSVAAA